MAVFKDFDFSDFWDDSVYSSENYIGDTPTDELIQSVEVELGYKLPASYIELMQLHNGGIVKNGCYPTTEPTSWAQDHVAIEGIIGIGKEMLYSLCGDLGSQQCIDEWGYPNIGVYICNCPSAGHDMIMLDYSSCGKDGEPEVVHIDQELDYKKTLLAKNFETFIRGLVNADAYDTSAEDLIKTLESLKTGLFSDTLQQYFLKDTTVDFDKVLRNLFTKLSNEKGYFALHDDELSYLAYDIQFYLLSINKSIKTKKHFLKEYLPMVAMSKNEISTGGYANFFETWFDSRVKAKLITKGLFSSYKFTPDFKSQLLERVREYE
ncbi:MAG: SMI1/KNR4 family protein [Bacteroidota bacterium]